MASVEHFKEFLFDFPRFVIQAKQEQAAEYQQRYYAAVKIQSHWKGYIVRKQIQNWNEMATVIQKNVRRWLVKCRLPEYYRQHYLRIQNWFYNKMATKIQAIWRGYVVRKSMNVLAHIRQERAIAEKNMEIMADMRKRFEMINSRERMEKQYKDAVLYTLFKTHHLLRTVPREGILSVHGKSELSPLECIMKHIPMKNYMNKLHKSYYNKVKDLEASVPRKKFTNVKFQRMYEHYISRDTSNDVEEAPTIDEDTILQHPEPFKLCRKPVESKYVRPLFSLEKYEPPNAHILERASNKRDMISRHDFNLNVRKIAKFSRKAPQPYYTDFWWKNRCAQHTIGAPLE